MTRSGESTVATVEAPAQRLGRADLQDRAIRGAAWTLINTLVSLPIAFLVNLFLARTLGVVDFGRLAFLTSLMDVAGSVLSVGLSYGLIQFGAKAHAAGRREAVRDLLQKSQGFRLFFVAPLISLLVLLVVDVSTPLMLVALAFGVWLPSALSGGAVCLGIENKTAQGARIGLLQNMLTNAAVVGVLLSIATSDAVWSARLVVAGLFAAVALLPISRDYRAAVLRPKIPRRFPPGFWRFSIPAGAAGIVAGLVTSRSEVFFLQALSTPVAVGTFSLAFGLASHVFAPAQALVGPLMPAVSGLREVDESSVARALARTIRASASIVAVLVAFVLPAFASVVPVLYGEEYGDAPRMLVVLGIAGGFLVLTQPIQAFVYARLLGAAILRVDLIALAVNVALAFLLIPPFGAWGAVAANAAAGLARLGLFLALEVRESPGAARELIGAASPAFLGAVGAVVGWLVSQTVPEHPFLGAVAGGLAGLLVLAVTLRLFRSGLTVSDRDAIVRTLPQRVRKFGTALLAPVTHHRGQLRESS